MKLVNRKRFDVDLRDSDTGRVLHTKKAVDITKECRNPLDQGEHAIILFTKAQKVLIVQLNEMSSRGSRFMGINFLVNGLDNYLTIEEKNDTFGSWTRRWGFEKIELINIIKALSLGM